MSFWSGLDATAADPVGVALVPWRWLSLALVVVWAWAAARGRRGVALAVGCAWAFLAGAFWTGLLAHPLGFGLDGEATRSTGVLAVAASSGRADEGVVAGEPASPSVAARAAAAVGSERWLHAVAVLAPALTPPLLALALLVAGGGERVGLTALLLLTAASGDLDVLRGASLAGGVWYWPEAVLGLPASLAAASVLGRHRRGVAACAVVGFAGASAIRHGLGLPAPAAPLPPNALEALWALTLDQGGWLALAAIRVFRAAGEPEPLDRAGLGLFVAGASTAFLGSAGAGPLADEPWAGFVLSRLGVLLLAGGLLPPLLAAGVSALPQRIRAGRPAPGLAAAALVLLTAPGAAVAWWEPHRLDPLYMASLEPLSTRALDAARWLDLHAPTEAVVLCSPHYAAEVLRGGRRRLLRAPSLVATGDEERRRRAQKAALTGRDAGPLHARYGLRFVFVGPGDFKEHGVAYPDDLDQRPRLELRHVAAGGFRIYEIAP